MAVIALDQSRRKKGERSGRTGEPAKVFRIDQLSDAVLLRVVQRQAAQELEQLKFILQVTGWDPTMIPTLDQMEEIENGTIEF